MLRLASLAAAATLCALAQSQQTITVTTRVCSTTPVTATTTVQSVVSVYPVGWTDRVIESGAPFVIRIQLSDGSGYQGSSYSEPSWLLYNGNTTTNPLLAGQYRLSDGQLSSVNCSNKASVDIGQSVEPFAVSPDVYPISSTFRTDNLALSWRNGNFSEGYAQFYKLPPNLLENARILAKLIGPMTPERGWSAIVLVCEPVPVEAQPAGGYGSNPCQGSATTTPLSSYAGTSSASSTSMSVGTSAQSQSSAASSSTGGPTPSPSSNVTPDGSCGPANGYNCIGAYSGSCCSGYNFCGSGPEYCGAGCQSAYGFCDENPSQYSSSSSSLSSSSSSSSVPVASSSTSSATSSSGSSAVTISSSSSRILSSSTASTISFPPFSTTISNVPSSYAASSSTSSQLSSSSSTSSQIPTSSPGFSSTSATLSAYPPYETTNVNRTAVCPDDSGSIITDVNGIEYRLACGFDTEPAADTVVRSQLNFNACFAFCDNSNGCGGFTFAGAGNGIGVGNCYLKYGTVSFTPGNPTFTSAIRITPGTGTMTTANPSTAVVSTYQAGPNPGTTSASTSSSGASLSSYQGVVTTSSSTLSLPSYLGISSSSLTSSSSPVGYQGDVSSSTSASASTTTSFPAGYTDGPTTEATPTPCPIVADAYTASPGSGDTDDGYCIINLPFDMTIYGTTSRLLFPNSNGVLGLDSGSTAYDVQPLPDTELAATSLLPFFDDLYIYSQRTRDTTPENPSATTGLPQGIYYTLSSSSSTDATAPPDTLNVTWILSRAGTYELYVFSLLYTTQLPGIVGYQYQVTGGPGSGTTAGGGLGDQSSNDGASAEVGVQGVSVATGDQAVYVQYSYLQSGAVTPGFTVICDTSAAPGSCTGSDGTVVEGQTAAS